MAVIVTRLLTKAGLSELLDPSIDPAYDYLLCLTGSTDAAQECLRTAWDAVLHHLDRLGQVDTDDLPLLVLMASTTVAFGAASRRRPAGGTLASYVSGLPFYRRSALLLRERLGLSYRDIRLCMPASVRTGLTDADIASWLYEAREALRGIPPPTKVI